MTTLHHKHDSLTTLTSLFLTSLPFHRAPQWCEMPMMPSFSMVVVLLATVVAVIEHRRKERRGA